MCNYYFGHITAYICSKIEDLNAHNGKAARKEILYKGAGEEKKF